VQIDIEYQQCFYLKFHRVCSIKCVKVRKVIINNFDHGKKSIEEKREAYSLGRNYS